MSQGSVFFVCRFLHVPHFASKMTHNSYLLSTPLLNIHFLSPKLPPYFRYSVPPSVIQWRGVHLKHLFSVTDRRCFENKFSFVIWPAVDSIFFSSFGSDVEVKRSNESSYWTTMPRYTVPLRTLLPPPRTCIFLFIHTFIHSN